MTGVKYLQMQTIINQLRSCYRFTSFYLYYCRSSISREKFEKLCEDLWEKALVPLKEVLQNSGLRADEISAVELIGGATRVPKLQVNNYF